MADDPNRPRITAENLDRIRARMMARANLGVDPASPAFLDVGMGSIFGDLEGPAALELDEFYDFAELVARATVPTTAYGEFLDDWAESLGLERKDAATASGVLRFTGAEDTPIGAGLTFTTAEVSDDEDPIAFIVTESGVIDADGVIDLPAAAVVAGSSGNVPASTVTVSAVEIDGLASVANPSPMTGGADVESDELLSARVADALVGGSGAGNQADYRRWLLSIPGVGSVTVKPIARGPGTVDLYIMDINNDPVPQALVDTAQAFLDPVAGQGLGQAPIGADALVLTPTGFAVTVAATITHEFGYSLTGAGGTRATSDAIKAAVNRYIGGLDVGADVVRAEVIAAIVSVPGVANVTLGTLSLNGSTSGDLAVADSAVAYAQAVNLT